MKISPAVILAALLVLAFSLATSLAPQVNGWSNRDKSNNVIGLMFGDGRKLFANHFFTMADVYFHSGYYPSVFDQHSEEQKEIIAASHGRKESEEDEKNENFFGRPKDWVDSFGRNFRITEHTHLEHHNEREILPWLRLAADLDPQKIDTFTVGAFFLREHLNQPGQAVDFLREGLRNNPDSYEILFELGRLYHDSYRDVNRARNAWDLGVKKFLAQPEAVQKDNKIVYEALVVNLAYLEKDAGNWTPAIRWFEVGKKVSPNPPALQQQIDQIRQKMAAGLPLGPAKLY